MNRTNAKEIEEHPYLTLQGVSIQLGLAEDEVQKDGYKEGGIWFSDTKSIVCGTFPPKGEYAGRIGYIHFPGSRNQFWKHFDKVFGTELFFAFKDSSQDDKRAENAVKKIQFCKTKGIGFIDVFTKISRRKQDAKDINLEIEETIFEGDVFDEILKSSVSQIIFVYSLSRDAFLEKIPQEYKSSLTMVRAYNSEDVPLEIRKIIVNERELLLTYCPIHGPIKWQKKQLAMKTAFELFR
ncbi:hypothetical protein TH53_06780 [Pedobacter lusitanus]|uniref:Uncharacterized protein n=1 Tax=Pedobacter lusitanus TaxID=1503925 RepID=A0A0D0F880_9SPHI|nr:hypothetical protein [Pedobacter lusitanus]KIO77838.1 hypothetical protein TH53_06780 [Pedobacter lusitanus]